MESVADIDITGIGWVAAGGMSGVLHKAHRMKMEWAAEVYDLCRKRNVPFLFKQASSFFTERGINALSIFHAEREGRNVDPATVPLIRAYPATEMPLLPFIEHGKRFTGKEWTKYTQIEFPVQGRRTLLRRLALLPSSVAPVTRQSVCRSARIDSDHQRIAGLVTGMHQPETSLKR